MTLKKDIKTLKGKKVKSKKKLLESDDYGFTKEQELMILDIGLSKLKRGGLKDWKETGDKLEWINIKHKDKIYINTPSKSFNKDYVFVYPSEKAVRRFKTKPQAVKFAKEYMKKN